MEIGQGEWEGRTHAELAVSDAARYAAWRARAGVDQPPGGETIDDALGRVVSRHGRPGGSADRRALHRQPWRHPATAGAPPHGPGGPPSMGHGRRQRVAIGPGPCARGPRAGASNAGTTRGTCWAARRSTSTSPTESRSPSEPVRRSRQLRRPNLGSTAPTRRRRPSHSMGSSRRFQAASIRASASPDTPRPE